MQTVTALELSKPHPRRIVVVGSGYAGMTCVVTLAHRAKPSDDIEIVMVAPLPYQQALSELDLVAAGTPRPQWAELWHGDIFRGLPIKVCYERLENVCAEDSTIAVGPDGAPVATIPYWRLVLATGAIPFVPPVPGLAEHGITMWSTADALKLQERVESQFKHAVTITNAEACRKAMAIAVVGAGATGVEVVGTLAYALPGMIRGAGYDPCMIQLSLIDSRNDILFDLKPREREKARNRLAKMGVDLILGSPLAKVEEGSATLQDGRVIPAQTVVWCGGAKADPDAVGWGLAVDTSGRLVIDTSLKAQDHDAIYAVGDVSALRDPETNRVLPMLAQFAIREAAHAAQNILRELRGQAMKPFEPHMHGEFVSVGPRWGVGWMFWLPVSGRFAIVMKRLTYVVYWLEVGTIRLAWRRTVQMMRMHRY